MNTELKIEKAIYNHRMEMQVLAICLEAIEEYGDKVYNKRFATFVNKELIKVFGSKFYERYGRDDEEVGNAYCYLTKEEFVNTRFNIVYIGKEIRTDYDNNKLYLGDSNVHEIYYSADTLSDLKDTLNARIEFTDKLIEKIKLNKKNLKALTKEHDKLVEKVDTFNNKLTYVLSDSLRIK